MTEYILLTFTAVHENKYNIQSIYDVSIGFTQTFFSRSSTFSYISVRNVIRNDEKKIMYQYLVKNQHYDHQRL